MKFKAVLVLLIVSVSAVSVLAADPKLEGAYKFVGLKFDGAARLKLKPQG